MVEDGGGLRFCFGSSPVEVTHKVEQTDSRSILWEESARSVGSDSDVMRAVGKHWRPELQASTRAKH